MHQYRLLRDNKESGPYSAADLESLGLKPYDLIWQEGKSAAWRYPGEITELKTFAPPVEEQPFDRFYRKPEPEAIPASRSNFAPRPAPAESHQVRKGHVVVTMPEGIAKARPSEPKPEPVYVRSIPADPVPVTQQIPIDQMESRSNTAVMMNDSRPAVAANSTSYKLPTIAASLLFVATLSVLLVNYNVQNKKITQLRDIVTQMQQNQPPSNPSSLSRTVVHYQDEQQASLLPPIDSPSTIDKTAGVPKVIDAQKENKASTIRKKQVTVPLISDTPLIVAEKIDKPVIQQEDGKRMAVKRDESDRNLSELVKVIPNDYKTGLLGGINNLKLTLNNKSLVPLRKVEVQIDYLGPESRVVKSQTVFFENVAPGGDPVIDVPKSNRGVKVNCTVKKIST